VAGTLIDSQAFPFADGGTGHACVLADGAPTPGQVDLLFINSNTVVTDVDGGGGAAFTLRVDATNSQGCYWYERVAVGGETDTITVETNGDHQTQVTFARWEDITFSDGGFTRADNSNNTVLPDSVTDTLAETDMLVLVGAGLHNFDGALATSPVWSDGYAALEAVEQGAAGSSQAVVGFTGYKQPVGTAAEPVDAVTWTNSARNRYATWLAYTTASANPPVEMGQAGEVDAAAVLGRSKSAALGQAAEVDSASALSRSKSAAAGRASEVDTAAPLGRVKVATLGRATDTNTAGTLTRSKAATLGRASEIDTAGAFGGGLEPVGAGRPLVTETAPRRLTTQTGGWR
jgi:hypothetical protein